ncbi:hypothetical protein NC651_034172 [Populus alba x Populus x berolinensis]|nr:hypothetical protein NC651_034172 [Populus alba x Populus x berolinensis]
MNEETPRKFTAKTPPHGSGLLFPPLAFSCLCFYLVKFIVLLASRASHSCWPQKKEKNKDFCTSSSQDNIIFSLKFESRVDEMHASVDDKHENFQM